MTANDRDQSACFEEIRQLRQISHRVNIGLNNQQQLLQIRNLSLAPDVITHVHLVDHELATLENHLQYEETELEQLRALTETSALINSSLDPDAILARAMDEIINLTGAERGYILLRNADSDELEFRVCREPEAVPGEAQGADISRTVLNEVFTSGKPLLTDNASSDPRMQGSETVAKFTLRSIMCVPLIYKDKITGAILRR